MKPTVLVVLIIAGTCAALDWVNTGDLAGARIVRDLVLGPNGRLYAAAEVDTAGADSGWVFVSPDFVNWERGGDLPGDVALVTSLHHGRGDTLFAGARASYQSATGPLLYSSSDKAASWQFRSQVTGARVGSTLTCLLEDHSGRVIAGHDYLSMHSSGAPCVSTDRGMTWSQGTVTGRIVDAYCLIEDGDNNLYCGGWGTDGVVIKSSDGGANWAATAVLYDAAHTRALANGPAGVVFAGTYPKTSPAEPIGRVFKTLDAGASWQQLGYGYFNSTSGIRSLCWTEDGLLFAGSAPSAEVFMSEDTGATWISTGAIPGAGYATRLVDVVIGDSLYIYAATNTGDVYRAYVPVQVGVRGPAAGPPVRGARLFPNPTCGELFLHLAGRATVTVVDAAGRQVVRDIVEAPPGRLTLDGLPAGVYLVAVRAGRTSWSEPVLLLGR